MKITKSRLKAIILEELESVMSEEEEETTTEGTEEEEQVEEAYAGADMSQRRRSPLMQRGTTHDTAGAAQTPTLDAAADALGMSPSELMLQLAQEMGVDLGAEGDAPLPVSEGK